MKIAGVIAALLLLAASAQAQYTSRLGRFQVDNIRGCAPFTMNITNANVVTSGECTPGKPCVMNYGNQPCPPATCQNLFTYTFNTPGTYKLSVTYQNIGADDITITVDASTPPPFEIYTCNGSKVEVNITDKTYDTYFIDFNNDGIVETTIPSGNTQTATYSYGAPGGFNISVRGKKVNAANNCAANVQSFTAISTLPAPAFNTLDAIDAATLQLGVTAQTNIQYQVEFATNSITNFQVYKNLYATNSLSVPNLTVDNNYYCFRLSSHDPCANTNKSTTPVCSEVFSLALASGVNKLSWKAAGTISNIDIERDGSNYTTVAGSATAYNDLTVTCKTQYCYKLKANYPNGAVSTSLQKCGTTFTNDVPVSIDNASSMVNGDQVEITWTPSPLYPSSHYSILRAVNKTGYLPYDNVSVPDYFDNAYKTENAICYEINYVDDCGNTSSQGQPICPVRLTGTVNDQNEITIIWNSYKGWKQGVKNYTVLKFNAAGTQIKSTTVTDTTLFDNQLDIINQVVSYKIIANPVESGVTTSVSNLLVLVKHINLYSPTAFNPESHYSENKTFIVRGHYISNLQLQIFDRWGTMVFSSDQNEAWDGRKDGITMPTATYVWTAQGIDFAGNTFKQAGTILLIRHKN